MFGISTLAWHAAHKAESALLAKQAKLMHPNNHPSTLRQNLDILGAQLHADSIVDPVLVMQACRNVVFAAGDKKPLPDDIFAPGFNDALARVALNGMCMALLQMLAAAQDARGRASPPPRESAPPPNS